MGQARTHRLGGWQAAAFRHLEHGRSGPALHRLLTEEGHPVTPERLTEWLGEGVSLGLLFFDGRSYVSLPLRNAPVRTAAVTDGAGAGADTGVVAG